MNAELETYARNYLKEGLAQLTSGNRRLFRQMYGKPIDPRARRDEKVMAEILALPIDQVVDEMDVDKLDNAMDQVKRTLIKAKKAAE